MRTIIPAQSIITDNAVFPLSGKDCGKYSTIVAMELYGCSIGEVARELECSVDEVMLICSSDDYNLIKRKIMDNLRKLDRQTLTGKIVQEANNAFDRMVELSESATREDVKMQANKDIMDRAFVANVAQTEADELRITFVKRR